jgi:predicted GNAT family acetyltransferase
VNLDLRILVCLPPTRRRRGIGEALAERCLAGLEALGITKCHLFVLCENKVALAFWRCVGWTERGDPVMMSRTLGNSKSGRMC